MTEPYYDDGLITIYHGDSADIVPQLGRFDLLLTDPPYGIGANKQTLGSGKKQLHRGGDWDLEAPETAHLLKYAEQSIIWGGNYFRDLPPSNDWLCWHKRNDGRSFSEFELAWTNLGVNCRMFSHHWSGEEKHHPTAKPVPLISWCIQLADNPQSILDPFMGSGTTLVAARRNGIRAVGIDLEEKYCEIAARRCQQKSLFEP